MIEIYSFRDFPSCDTQKDGTTTVITGLTLDGKKKLRVYRSVCLQSQTRFRSIRGFDQNQLVLPYFIEYTL